MLGKDPKQNWRNNKTVLSEMKKNPKSIRNI
jgi:hypothetical protein